MSITNQSFEFCQVLAGFVIHKCVFCTHKDKCSDEKQKLTMMKDTCAEFDFCTAECYEVISLYAEQNEICRKYPYRKPFSDEFLDVDDNDDNDF